MGTGVKNLSSLAEKLAGANELTESQIERDRRLLVLLGEVIRMSQAWVKALEAGDPFAAEKHEAECMAAMEKFDLNRKKTLERAAAGFEQTR